MADVLRTGTRELVVPMGAKRHWFVVAASLVVAIAVAACGGGGGGTDTPPLPSTPVITSQPASVSVGAGSSASFTVAASGGGLAYQWQRSTNGGLTFSDIAAASGASYSIAAVNAPMTGQQFRVVIQNTAGIVTSAAATLTVTGVPSAPVITQQPTEQTTAPPTSATFTVAFTGSPTPTVQWQVSLNGGVTWTNISGATAASFSTAGGVFGQGASNNLRQYRALVTNASGSVTSNTATWLVRPVTLGGLPNALHMSASGELTVLLAPNYSQDSVYPLTNAGAARFERVAANGTVSALAGGDIEGLVNGSGATARFNLGGTASAPFGIGRDGAGNVYVPEFQNNVIRRIAPDGTVSTFAAGGARILAAADDGTVYLERSRRIVKIAGGIETTLSPVVDAIALTVDSAGTLYVLQSGSVLRITAAGVVSGLTLNVTEDASASARYSGIAVDSTTGTMYLTDAGLCIVRKVAPNGTVTTLAGGNAPTLNESCGNVDGTGRAAKFSYKLFGIVVDAAGNIYVADGDNLSIRKITPAGAVTTLAR